MTDNALTVAEAVRPTGVINTPLPKLDELADFMARSGPMVGPSMQGKPERCRAVAYLADRWGMDPFSVSSELFFFKDRTGADRMAFGAKLIVALVNSRAPLAEPLLVSYAGQGGTRCCIVSGLLKGAAEPSVLQTPTVAQIKVKNSPLWLSDPDQQLAYYGQRAWARRFTPEAILGLYDPEEMQEVAAEIVDPVERATALFDDTVEDAHVEPVPTDAVLEEGRAAADRGTVALAAWWERLTPGEKADYETIKDDDLKPHALAIDAAIADDGRDAEEIATDATDAAA